MVPLPMTPNFPNINILMDRLLFCSFVKVHIGLKVIAHKAFNSMNMKSIKTFIHNININIIGDQIMQNYLPSDIKSPALRKIYYDVQKTLEDRYEKALKVTHDKNTRRKLTEQFNAEIKDAINYYVNLC